MVASGWFKDPYGRHEARWISEGRPTSLVRDGTREANDAPTGQMIGSDPTATPVPENAPIGGSDLRRSDDENRQPQPERDRYGTMAFDTMARPPLCPVPGFDAVYDSPPAGQRRARGFWFITLGVFAILGGLYLIQTPSLPTHRFAPSLGDLAVLHNGGTAVPRSCPDSVESSVPDEGLGLSVTPLNASTQFTVYPHSELLVYGDEDYSPEFSASAPACQLDDSDGFTSSETTYYLEGPGRITVYFIDKSAQVSVVRVAVTASPPPSTWPGWALIVLGGLACIFGVVLWYRRRDDGQPGDDLRRADDAARAGGFDPQRAQRAAWDALDQSSGQL